WCARLTAVLHTPPDGDTRRLLLVAGWPITSSRDKEVAYLTQYPVLDRAVAAGRDPVGYPTPEQVPWVVCWMFRRSPPSTPPRTATGTCTRSPARRSPPAPGPTRGRCGRCCAAPPGS